MGNHPALGVVAEGGVPLGGLFVCPTEPLISTWYDPNRESRTVLPALRGVRAGATSVRRSEARSWRS